MPLVTRLQGMVSLDAACRKAGVAIRSHPFSGDDAGNVLALLDAAKEAREALAAAARVIVNSGLTIAFRDEAGHAGVADGFGVRLQSAIRALEE
jgi:hypothetical protein